MTTTTKKKTYRPGDKIEVACQHSGNWGPWYHSSIYEGTPRGTWVKVGFGEYGHTKNPGDLHKGRPTIKSHPIAL